MLKPLRNIRLTILYDGTCYKGWQKTKEGPSIEQALEDVLVQILQHPVQLQAASRTDAGVHAKNQVVNFFSAKEDLDFVKLQYGLNRLIANDIAIKEVAFAEEKFHPTLDCKEKEYIYLISTSLIQLPLDRLYAWHCHSIDDIDAMQQAAAYFLGSHDFTAFCNQRKGLNYDHYIREIYSLDITKENDLLKITIRGNNFLYRMVRNIVGTLVYVGQGKIKVEDIPSIIKQKDRTKAGITAPAHGLYLNKLFY